MQTVGTHNSYHITPDKKIVEFLDKKTTKILLGEKAARELPDVWEATMKPLSQQLQQLGEYQAVSEQLLLTWHWLADCLCERDDDASKQRDQCSLVVPAT